MRLEDCFVFISPEEITIKGTGVGIEKVLYDYLYRFEHAEAIASHYPTVRVEQVYAAITYFWFNQPEMESYVAHWMQREKASQEQQTNFSQATVPVHQLMTVQAA